MPAQPEVTQRDLRNRSKEIMDAVENGQSFAVTRGGHQIAELIAGRRPRTFVSQREFAAMSRVASTIDLDTFRADQEVSADRDPRDPDER